MPIIQVDGPRISDLDKKRALVAELTAAAARAYELPEDTMIVLLKENPPENVGLGGGLLADR